MAGGFKKAREAQCMHEATCIGPVAGIARVIASNTMVDVTAARRMPCTAPAG